MRARLLLAAIATCVAGTLGGSVTRAQEPRPLPPSQEESLLPLPPSLEESLAWRADPEMVLRAFRVRPPQGRAAPVQSATSRAMTPESPAIMEEVPLDAATDVLGALRARRTSQDVAIASDPGILEVRPSVVTSPRRQDVVIMAYLGGDFPSPPALRCFVSRSRDRGRRWSQRLQLPMLSSTSICGAPALAYSPDGRYLYAAYQDQRSAITFLAADGSLVRADRDTDIVVTRSRDDGRTWRRPVRALDGAAASVTYQCAPAYPDGCVIVDSTPGSSYERPSVAAGGDGHHDASSVYVASTQLPEEDATAPPTMIRLARSRDRGRTWGSAVTLDAGEAGSPEVIVQGPSIATGRHREVLVAWYHSGIDGPLFGVFEIRVRQSGNRGRTWGSIVTAASDELETGFSLGSLPFKRWWTTMFPAALIDREGRAHIVYTQDPEPLAETAEEGDVRYVGSRRPPYDSWSQPVDVNDDGPGRAQGFASLATRRRGHTTLVEAVWEDTRLAPESAPGMTAPEAQLSLYDIFHARLVPARGLEWSMNRRVSDVSSVQNAASTNDRTALTAAESGLVFAVWSDRRDKTGPADPGDDLFGSRITR